jgi:hypothetical protein
MTAMIPMGVTGGALLCGALHLRAQSWLRPCPRRPLTGRLRALPSS